jgi:hypothetical protein
MSSTRASNARHVRQRKLNTKQPLRVIREDEIDELPEDEAQRNIPQFETGVEKAEEVVSTHSPTLLLRSSNSVLTHYRNTISNR